MERRENEREETRYKLIVESCINSEELTTIIKLALRDELMCLVSDIVEHLQIALNQCPMLKYRT